jgi:hypothetical protein
VNTASNSALSSIAATNAATLSAVNTASNAFSKAEADIFWVNMGDLHLGVTSPVITGDTNSVYNTFSNSVTKIIEWKNNGTNIVAFTSPGDLVDSGADINAWLVLSNNFRRLKNAGIEPVVSPGNHEVSAGQPTNWDNTLTTNLLTRDWYRDGTNTRYTVWTSTNRTVRLAFVTASGALADDTIAYANTNWPNHKLIFLTHFYYDAFGAFSSTYETRRQQIRACNNAICVLSGHWRCPLAWGTTYDQGLAGQTITCNFQNSQQMTNAGNHIIRLYRVSAQSGVIESKTWDNINSLWLTNGQQTATGARAQSNGYYANFDFPLGDARSPSRIELRGEPQEIKNPAFDESDGATIYAGQSNSVMLDTSIALSRITNGLVWDKWLISRTRTNSGLEFRYAPNGVYDEQTVALVTIDTNGIYSGTASNASKLGGISAASFLTNVASPYTVSNAQQLASVPGEAYGLIDTNRVICVGYGTAAINQTYARMLANLFTNSANSRIWTNDGTTWYHTTAMGLSTRVFTATNLWGPAIVGSGANPGTNYSLKSIGSLYVASDASLAGVVITNGGLTVSGDENFGVGSTVSGFYTNNSTSVGGTTTNQTLVNPVIAGNLTGGFGNTNGNFTNYWPGGMLVLYSPPVSGITMMQTNYANQSVILWDTNADFTVSGNMTNKGMPLATYGNTTTSGQIPIYNGTNGLNGAGTNFTSSFAGAVLARSFTSYGTMNVNSNLLFDVGGVGYNPMLAASGSGSDLAMLKLLREDDSGTGSHGIWGYDGTYVAFHLPAAGRIGFDSGTSATIAAGDRTPEAWFNYAAVGSIQVNSNMVAVGNHVGLYTQPSTNGLSGQGGAIGCNGTNWWTVFRDSGGGLATNKISLGAWP